jgi:4-amino-4-deoxy-L-arabinose transferase-like glycosyltransferase
MQWLHARPLLTLATLAGLLCASGLAHELWTPDEPRVAEIGRAMWRSGDWVVPRLGGEPFLEKPPLYWWAEAGVFTWAGRATATLARLPSALFAFLSALLTYALGRRFFGAEAAMLGALVLLSTGEFAVTSHWIVVDNALVTAVTAAWVCFSHALSCRGLRRALYLAGLYLALAAAFLAKGVVGLAIPCLGMVVFLIWMRRLRAFVGWHLVPGAALVIGAAGAWLWALWRAAGPEALRGFVVYNQLGRFLPGAFGYEGGHERPIWYYAVNAPALWLPWTPWLGLALLAARRGWRHFDASAREGIALCLSASVPTLLALSLAGTKRGMYLDPLCPPLALLVGAWMLWPQSGSRLEARLERGWRVALVALSAASSAGIFFAWSHWPWAGVGTLLLVAFAWCWRHAPPVTRTDRHLASTVIVVLAAANLFMTITPFADGYKSFVPFVAALQRAVPAEDPLYAYRPDETLIGVVGFYTERRVEEVDLGTLARLAQAERTQWVLVRDRHPTGGNYAAIQSAGIPHRVVSEILVGNQRTLRILALGAMNTASERAPDTSQP